MAPLPSAGKYDLVDYEDSDLISRKKKGKSGIFQNRYIFDGMKIDCKNVHF